MDVPFEYIHGGKYYHDPRVLTVVETIAWLDCGKQVQLFCEASPWPAALGSQATSPEFEQRSFAGMSATLPARVAIVPVANVPRTGADEFNEMNEILGRQSLALSQEHPDFDPGIALQQGRQASEASDGNDVAILSRLCFALNIAHTALVNEAVLVYSPSSEDLLSALAIAIVTRTLEERPAQWRFVSDRPDTLENIANRGGMAVHPRLIDGVAFGRVNPSRDPRLGVDRDRGPLPPP